MNPHLTAVPGGAKLAGTEPASGPVIVDLRWNAAMLVRVASELSGGWPSPAGCALCLSR
jgi:hypothetical protein